MKRSMYTVPLVVAIGLAMAACGNGDEGDRDTGDTNAPSTVPATSVAPSTSAGPGGYVHATGPDDVVLRLEWQGGYVPQAYAFTALARLVITGEGAVYTQGAQVEIYPQPLLPPALVGRIDEDELQDLLRAADEAGMLAHVTYEAPTNIADAPNTVLTLTVDGTTYVHNAYALGLGGTESDPARTAFAEYVQYLETFMAEPHGEVPFVPDSYAIRAVPEAQAPKPADGIEPDEVQWPADAAGVALAAATECAVVPSSAVQDVFAEATQITRFVDAGERYVLLVRPMVPGDPGC
jgi:hypothetical protein